MVAPQQNSEASTAPAVKAYLERRLLFGGILATVGAAGAVGTGISQLSDEAYGWLLLGGISMATVGLLLACWSLSAMGSVAAEGAAVSLPGLSVTVLSLIAGMQLVSRSQSALMTVLAFVGCLGLFWAFVGPVLVLRYRRAMLDAQDADVQGPPLVPQQRSMTLYQRLMVIGTFSAAAATLVVGLLQKN